jgi:acyl-CoA dehydrogenase
MLDDTLKAQLQAYLQRVTQPFELVASLTQPANPTEADAQLQQLLADSVIEINAARWMVYHAAWMLYQGMDAREQIAMVKVHAAETLGRVVDRAVQVFGGMGFCKELPIERYYRDARIYRIYDGTSEIHRGVIAKSAMKKGAVLFDVNR